MNIAPRIFVAVLLTVGALMSDALSADMLHKELSVDEERSLREAAKNRPRRIIFNDDGNVPVYVAESPDPQEVLSKRTMPLRDTQVDSIFLCTMFGSFGMFTHDTKVGQVFDLMECVDDKGRNVFAHNQVRKMIDAGNDHLWMTTQWCKENGKEIFWSLRMNDTHDGSTAWYGKPWFAANRLKQAHPEWLMGSADSRPRFGAWTAMDFQHAEVRDLVFQFVQEVCRNYDIDGVELDFFRHPVFFQRPANGKPCGQDERDAMTDLIARICAMTQAEGRKRGRPILLAVRVPDSVDYCRAIGLDLEEWLQRGYVDLLVAGGYFQLNPWEYSVALGHRYGARVYPSLDESRVRDPAAQGHRRSASAYLARAQDAWTAGADGIYVFNYSDLLAPASRTVADGYSDKFASKAEILRHMGSVDTLVGDDKTYFASVQGDARAAGGNYPYDEFLNVLTLNPHAPLALDPHSPCQLTFSVGEESIDSPGKQPDIVLHLYCEGLSPKDELQATLNGTALRPMPHSVASQESAPNSAAAIRAYSVDSKQLLRGNNHVLVQVVGEDAARTVRLTDLSLKVVYAKD